MLSCSGTERALGGRESSDRTDSVKPLHWPLLPAVTLFTGGHKWKLLLPLHSKNSSRARRAVNTITTPPHTYPSLATTQT